MEIKTHKYILDDYKKAILNFAPYCFYENVRLTEMPRFSEKHLPCRKHRPGCSLTQPVGRLFMRIEPWAECKTKTDRLGTCSDTFLEWATRPTLDLCFFRSPAIRFRIVKPISETGPFSHLSWASDQMRRAGRDMIFLERVVIFWGALSISVLIRF